jgi:hypothetical protein
LETSIRNFPRELLEVENGSLQLSQSFLDKRSLLDSRSATRKKIDHSLMCPDRDILLPVARGRGVFNEGITSKLNELETQRQFGKNQVSHDRFGFGQSSLLLLDGFAKPLSGSVTHEALKPESFRLLVQLGSAIKVAIDVKDSESARY